MFRYRNTPERLAFRDVEGQAKAAQISEARASQAAARDDLKRAAQHLPFAEALDLLVAHYAGQVSPDELHDELNLKTREADRRRGIDHLTTNGAALARVAMGGE